MNYSTLLFRFFVTAILALSFPCLALAKTPGALSADIGVANEGIIDSVVRKQPVKPEDRKQDEKNKDGKKVDVKKPDIKEVPKAKRQLKPAALKGKVKIPVKRVKPVIKRPVGLIRRNLGI